MSFFLQTVKLHAGLLAGGLLLPIAAGAAITNFQIVSDAADGEVRQSSAGAYTVATGAPDTHLRVGFQSSFGSNGQANGGLAAVWFFKLPQINPGDSVASASFVTTLLDESSASPITPRFNADLYALGFTSTPGAVANGTFFFAGQNQSGAAGIGAGQSVQRIDDDMFALFSDWNDVNAQAVKTPKPVTTDATGSLNLAGYIQSIYDNPAFPNTGNEYLILRLNPDQAANATYIEGGNTQFYGNGTTRYRVANAESANLVSTAGIDYSQVIPTRLNLGINAVPEPGTAALLALGAGGLLRRRRVSPGITR